MAQVVILLVATSFLICYLSINVLIKIANQYNIYDKVTNIKKHNRNISFLGGIGMVLSFLIASGILIPEELQKSNHFTYFRTIIFSIFLFGLGDDFFNYSPIRKFLFQIFLIGILFYKTDLYIPIEILPNGMTPHKNILFLITLFISVAITNAYNLIDGSDGLAGSLTLLSCIFFSLIFYNSGDHLLFLMTVSISASSLAFLFYNKPPAKIFMGDSGSLFIGVVISYFALNAINNHNFNIIQIGLNQTIIIVYSLMSIPILDMIRLFLSRLTNGENPLKGDNNHIHHIMRDIGFTSKQRLFIIITLQILNIGFAVLSLNSSWVGFIMLNITVYLLIIQLLRQLKTYLKNLNERLNNNTNNLSQNDNTDFDKKVFYLKEEKSKKNK